MLRPSAWLVAAGLVGLVPPAAGATLVDACTLVDPASVDALVGSKLTLLDLPGVGLGVCDFSIDRPRPLDISISYLPLLPGLPPPDPSRYGLGQPMPLNQTPVPHLGDGAVFDQETDTAANQTTETLSVEQGGSILSITITLEKSLRSVPQDKLQDFARGSLVKMAPAGP